MTVNCPDERGNTLSIFSNTTGPAMVLPQNQDTRLFHGSQSGNEINGSRGIFSVEPGQVHGDPVGGTVPEFARDTSGELFEIKNRIADLAADCIPSPSEVIAKVCSRFLGPGHGHSE